MSEEYVQTSLFKKLNNTKYTYKSSTLIESSYELSLMEQRIISLACKKIQPIYIENRIKPSDLQNVLGAMKFSQIEISVNEFKREYNVKSNDLYVSLKESSKLLFKREINYIDEVGKETDRRWTSSGTYDEKNNKILLTFNPDLILDLLVFKGKYVALFFDMTQNIKSKYAFRIYEILKNNIYMGEYTVSLEDFRRMLALKSLYPSFAELNRTVIKPNLEVINKYSDIQVEFEPLRSGRVVKNLKFILKTKDNKTFAFDNNFKDKIPNSYKEINEALKQYKVELTSADVETLFNKAIESTTKNKIDIDATSFILDKIEQMKKYSVNVKEVKGVVGFLNWAIETNYTYKENTVHSPKKKLKFDNFEGRNQGKEYYDDLEGKLLGWDDE